MEFDLVPIKKKQLENIRKQMTAWRDETESGLSPGPMSEAAEDFNYNFDLYVEMLLTEVERLQSELAKFYECGSAPVLDPYAYVSVCSDNDKHKVYHREGE